MSNVKNEDHRIRVAKDRRERMVARLLQAVMESYGQHVSSGPPTVEEVIARADVDEFKVNEVSLMPEQLEKQLTSQEIVDLFAFISLDKHPSDTTARKLAGSGEA